MKPFLPVFEWLENWLFRNAIGVVAVCDFIANRAKDAGSNFVMVLRDCPPEQMEEESLCASSKQLKAKYNIRGKCVMYIGNLEKYQGIDLLIESFSLVLKHNIKPPPSLVIVGGKHEHIKKYKKMAKELNISENVFFEGPSPISELRLLFKEADVLVSPRIQGKNTPMKIYSYLYSGKPIVATNLPTHTQVIDDTMAFLVEPNVTAFSHGIVEALLNENKSKEKALKALAVAKEKYTNSAFRKTLHCFYKKIEQLVCVDKNLR
jgi:glycosyltransferase involved in cell wall biosynthesis